MHPPIVYFMNTDYPNPKAHSIQITKVLFGLSRHTDVTFICNQLTAKDDLLEKISDQYGYDLSPVRFLEIPKKKLTGFLFYITLGRLCKAFGKDTIFYTRSYNMAKRLGRTRLFHSRKVILESHKKSGYRKEDNVESSRYASLRGTIERNNKSIRTLKKIYRRVDAITFTSNESRRIVEKEVGVRHTEFIWYPLDGRRFDDPRDKGIVYCGSLAPNKLINLLLDALESGNHSVQIDILGGTPQDIRRVKCDAEKRGVSNNLTFLGRVPYREVPKILGQYRYGLSLMEGLKVTDYVECGLVPIIPQIPMYTEIFDNRNAIFFNPDDPTSLIRTLTTLDGKNISSFESNHMLSTFSVDATAKKILSLAQPSKL
jgi:glycosyltransferase involved in cell wall biosynthesis